MHTSKRIVVVEQGDVLDARDDVMICTANPYLRLTGGVNGALLQRGGLAVQRELEAWLVAQGRTWVPPETVVRTGPGPLAVRHILHAVAIDGFYKCDVARCAGTLREAFRQAVALGAETLATPALATGYGPLSMAQFAEALRVALSDAPQDLTQVRVVLRKAASAAVVREVLGTG